MRDHRSALSNHALSSDAASAAALSGKGQRVESALSATLQKWLRVTTASFKSIGCGSHRRARQRRTSATTVAPTACRGHRVRITHVVAGRQLWLRRPVLRVLAARRSVPRTRWLRSPIAAAQTRPRRSMPNRRCQAARRSSHWLDLRPRREATAPGHRRSPSLQAYKQLPGAGG